MPGIALPRISFKRTVDPIQCSIPEQSNIQAVLQIVHNRTCSPSKVSCHNSPHWGRSQKIRMSLPVRKPKIVLFLLCELLASCADEPAMICVPLEPKEDSHQTNAFCVNESSHIKQIWQISTTLRHLADWLPLLSLNFMESSKQAQGFTCAGKVLLIGGGYAARPRPPVLILRPIPDRDCKILQLCRVCHLNRPLSLLGFSKHGVLHSLYWDV